VKETTDTGEDMKEAGVTTEAEDDFQMEEGEDHPDTITVIMAQAAI
jgi:hypothetical protein